MKQIELKELKQKDPAGNDAVLNYADYLRVIMQSPMNPQAGADIEEIRHSIRVLEALDTGGDDGFALEDADYAFMVRKIKTAKFMFINKEILKFIDDVTGVTNG